MPEQGTALRLLVAVDGSEHSNGALRLLAALARRRARLHAVVLNVQLPVMVGEVGVIAPASIASESRHRAAAEVLGAAGRVLAEAGVSHECVEELDAPAAAIVACAGALRCSAIVIGSRGLGPVRSALLGSVSGRVTRRADRPVIVIGTPDAALPEGPLRVLAALDGSERALRALGFAALLARALPSSELHLLYVQTPHRPVGVLLARRRRPAEHAAAENAERIFSSARDVLDAGASVGSSRVVEDRVPAAAIARAAAELHCGMIAMGTRGLGAMAGPLLGSAARGVLRRVRTPVILSR